MIEETSVFDNTFLTDEKIEALCRELPTPFYLYDEAGIRSSCRALKKAFSWNAGFREFFPVKATPNASILKILQEEGMGIVCSSAPELMLAEQCGFQKENVFFAPNYPLPGDISAAAQMHASVILDGAYLVEPFLRAGCLTEQVGLRYNPGGSFCINAQTISTPETMKFGFSRQQIFDVIPQLRRAGISETGLHAYLCGNVIQPGYYAAIARLLCQLAVELTQETGIRISFINISGGLGLAYQESESAPDLEAEAEAVRLVFEEILKPAGLWETPLYTELGRFLLGPNGILISRILYVRELYGTYIGLDACAANLMRPMLYDAYHHISVVGRHQIRGRKEYEIVGSIPENTDRMSMHPRLLPPVQVGDLVVIHDTGAHGHSMGYNYAGKLRSAEYLWQADGTPRLIRRAETAQDYLATQLFQKSYD